MKVLIHDYAGHPFPVGLSRELARRGHGVVHAYASELLTPRGTFGRRGDDGEGLSFVTVPMDPGYRANKYSFLKRLLYERRYGVELVAMVQRVRPDVILSGQTPSEPHWRMVRDAGGAGIPVVTWVQDFYSLAVDRLARKKLPVLGAMAGRWYRSLDARAFAGSAAIVAITEDFRSILDGFGVPPANVHVIPNWAPLAEMPLRPRENDWGQAQGFSGKFVFLYSGTLAMKHNPALLTALAQRYEEDPDVVVAVISEGPGMEWLKQQKARGRLRRLVLLPFQPFSRMPEVLASADVLLTVLEAEAGVFSVPSKVLTYHAAGRPILGAMPAENLASRIIRQADSGICVDPSDLGAWITTSERLRVDADLRSRLGRNARAYAEREFDIAKIADRFEAIFRGIVRPGSSESVPA